MSDLLRRAKDLLSPRRESRYVRVLTGRFAQWLSTNGDIESLAVEAFTGLPDEDVSVFRATTPEAELRIVAAQQLTKSGVDKDAYILRLRPRDVAACRILVHEEQGETGVPEVDREHRNLRSPDPKVYRELCRLVFEQQRKGADLVRQFKRNVILCEFERLLLCSGASAMSPVAKPRCRKFLEMHEKERPAK